MVSIEEIKSRLENSDKFKYEKKEFNISFEDFEIIDISNQSIMQVGRSKGLSIIVDGSKLSSFYPI